MQIKSQLLMTFSLVAVVGGVTIAAEYATLEEITADGIPTLRLVSQIKTGARRVQSEALEYVVTHEQAVVEQLEESALELTRANDQITGYFDDPGEAETLLELIAIVRSIEASSKAMVTAHREMLLQFNGFEQHLSALDTVVSELMAQSGSSPAPGYGSPDGSPILADARSLRTVVLEFRATPKQEGVRQQLDAIAVRLTAEKLQLLGTLSLAQPGHQRLAARLDEVVTSLSSAARAAVDSHAVTLDQQNTLEAAEQALTDLSPELDALVHEDVTGRDDVMKLTAILGIAVILILAVLLGVMATRRILTPLRALRVATSRIEKGEFDARVEVTVRNEIGELAGSFNVMAEQLDKLMAEMTTRLSDLREAREEALLAQSEAESANQAKSEFLANMSHEIRTPLNAIIGMTGLLLNEQDHLDAEHLHFVETIRDAGDNLLAVLNDILDFSKIEARQLDLEEQPFDLRRCLDTVVDLLAPKAAGKGVELISVVESGVPVSITGDATRLRQIVANLLSNAIKFTEHGKVLLEVSVKALVDDPDLGPETTCELHFKVQDTGVGIPEDRLETIFESFAQADTSTTRNFGGTGLGLTICRRLVEIMDGHIWVESTVGWGSVFRFSIPAPIIQEARPAYLLAEQPRLTGKQLLIVDDNATNRRILCTYGESWGMRVAACASGPEALARIRGGEPFDLAILDYHMPGCDGLQLADEIRKVRDARSLPLVLLTSVVYRLADPRLAHFIELLTKPIKQSQLHGILVTILAMNGQAANLPSILGKRVSEYDPTLASRVPLRILVVEDVPMNQTLIRRMLERLGYEADVASNGIEALESLRRQPYDVVLMDELMPEMDGLTATRQIRRGDSTRQPRIIAVSANAMVGDRERFVAAGMDDHVAKPIVVKELIAALERCGPSRTAKPDVAQADTVEPEPAAEPSVEPSAEPSIEPSGVDEAARAPAIEPQEWLQLVDLMGGEGSDDLIAIVRDYRDNSSQLLDEARRALAGRDGRALQLSAHSLISTSANLGAIEAADQARELEHLIRSCGPDEDPDWQDLAAIVERLEREVRRAQAALPKYD